MIKTKSNLSLKQLVLILFIGVLLSSNSLLANEVPDTIAKPSLSIYVRPLALWANYHRLQFGVDYRLPSFTRFGLVLGFGNSEFIKHPKSYVLDYSLYEIHPQVQFFLKKHVSVVNIALGAEFIFSNITSHLGPSRYAPKYNTLNEFDSATLIEKIRVFHFISSIVILLETHIVFESYLGIGFGSRMKEYKDLVNERPYSSGGSSWISFPSLSGPPEKSDGEQGGLSATFGFKIGYRF